jgi:hypothetical protein
MTTTLTARVPEDLLAAVPVVLGFRPQDSLVMLTFDAPRPFHARVDLPSSAEAEASLPELVDALVGPCLTHRVGRVVFVSYSDDAGLSARVASALRTAFGRAGIGVIDVLRAHAGSWRRVPARPGARETPAVPYDDEAHAFTAQAVFEGRVTLASREDLRDTLASAPDEVARVAALQAGETAPGPEDVGAVVGGLVARCVATGESLVDADAARVLGAVVQVEVRDAALYAVTLESAAAHLRVWADLLRRAPECQVPDSAAVVAFCAWQAGHGALAWCALDRCFDVDPDHRLGGFLAECLTRAVPPGAWHETVCGPAPNSGAAWAEEDDW